MKAIAIVSAALAFAASPVYAQSKPGMKPDTAGAAAEKSAGSAGIAKDPGEVKAQQGEAGKSSPGTVGAAPGADTNSQDPKK